MSSTTLYTFDPGKTTGVCCAEVHNGLPRNAGGGPAKPTMLWGAEVVSPADWKAIYDRMAAAPPQLALVEKFRIFPWKAKELGWDEVPAAVYRGYVEAYCLLLRIPLHYQSSNEMKAFERVGELAEAFGLSTRALPASEHIRDAMRHTAMMHYRIQRQGRGLSK